MTDPEDRMAETAQDWDDEEYDDRDDEPCDHDDQDIDILTGRWSCYRCNESGYTTSEQIDAQIQFQREYAEYEERENRRQWWRDLFVPVADPIRSMVRRINEWQTRRRFSDRADDDIPF